MVLKCYNTEIRLPSEEDRIEIIKIHLSKRATVVTEAVLQEAASKTENFTGSDLENLVNEAAFLALRRGRIDPDGCAIKDEDLLGKQF